jgi:acyl-CoA synthetase (AMP-forming)/AMP-acid ligase II
MGLLISDLFRRNAASAPQYAAASMDDRSLTHAQLNAQANRLAALLRERGIGRGDRVVTWCDTSLEVLALFAATSKLGAVFAPLNARLGIDETIDIIELARPSLLVGDAERGDAVVDVAKRTGVRDAVRLGGSGPADDLLAASAHAPDAEIEEPLLAEADPHVLFFTSGSTGRSKGVVLSHRANYLRSFQGVFQDQPERTVCMFPLFHMAGFTLCMGAWQTRGQIILVKPPSAERLLDAVVRHAATRLYLLPAVMRRILDEDTSRWDLSSLRDIDTGTSATPIELIREVKQRFPGTRTRIVYGSTEAGTGTMLGDADVLRKPGSVGLPPPGGDLRLSLRNGWYHTGDLGALDDEGYLTIVGRVRDVIRTGGEGVSPSEVEAVLATHPAVHEVAVVGVPDTTWGEIVCAVVVPAPGVSLTLEEIQAHCQGKLARFKQPRRLERIDALPRTAATRQIQRRLLVEQILTAG